MEQGRTPALNDPILIDECLSPDLVAYALDRGYNATHVLYRGLRGKKDPALMPVIRAEGYVLVTNNGRDFLKLYAAEEMHAGLIIIVHGNGTAEVQVDLFGRALNHIETLQDLTNKLLQVFEDGRIEVSDYPSDAASKMEP